MCLSILLYVSSIINWFHIASLTSFSLWHQHLITNIAIIEERGRLKKLLFQNEIIIYKKEYDIRLVASLIKGLKEIWQDKEAAFLDLHLSISNDIVSTKIYDKRDDFDFEIVNFPFLDGDVPRSTSYGVYIPQLIRFARASSYAADFNTRNKLLTQRLLKQGYRYHKLRKTFSKFYRRYYDFISKFQVGLKSILRQGLSEPDFYGDLVYKMKNIFGSNNFSAQFIKIISHYKKDWL